MIVEHLNPLILPALAVNLTRIVYVLPSNELIYSFKMFSSEIINLTLMNFNELS